MSKTRIFGCSAYAHIPDSQRRKLDRKAQKLVFVGYQGSSENSRLIDLNTFKVTIAASATFDEGCGDLDFFKIVGAVKVIECDSEEDYSEETERHRVEVQEDQRDAEEGQIADSSPKRLRDRSTLKKPDRLSYP